MKTCSKCGEEKSLDCFYTDGKLVGGEAKYRSDCKPCSLTAARERKREAYHKRKQDPEFMERRRARQRVDALSAEQVSMKKLREQRSSKKAVANGKATAKNVARRAAKLQQTPSWANDQLIAAYYKEAKRLEELTGIQFHVDHIIPLQGELVSGLHVETNLQLLPAHENLGKSNRFDPETFVA